MKLKENWEKHVLFTSNKESEIDRKSQERKIAICLFLAYKTSMITRSNHWNGANNRNQSPKIKYTNRSLFKSFKIIL